MGAWQCTGSFNRFGFGYGLTSQSRTFQTCLDGAIASSGSILLGSLKCHAQGHYMQKADFKPKTSCPVVLYSTTMPAILPIYFFVLVSFNRLCIDILIRIKAIKINKYMI